MVFADAAGGFHDMTRYLIGLAHNGNAFADQQLDKIGRARSRQNYSADSIAAPHSPRQVQLVPGNVRRIGKREKRHVPPVSTTGGLRTDQNFGLERGERRTVTEEEGKDLGFCLSLRGIRIELRSRVQHRFLSGLIDAVIPI